MSPAPGVLLMLLMLLCVSEAHAGEDDRPSLELLLYLAEWGEDRDGRLLDPLEIDAGAPAPVAAGQATEESPWSPEPIR